VFASLVLVDEINRATPRTQAALLEAMQEGQVTAGGKRFALPKPFWVLATQNPIELEGTYPLPEAQLDRFLFKIQVPYPDADAMHAILDQALDREPADDLTTILEPAAFAALQAWCAQVVVADPVKRAAVELVLATQPTKGRDSAAERHLRYGASPRGLQAIVRGARVNAVLENRAHVAIEDLRDVALPALRHRVLLRVESELEGYDTDRVLTDIVETWLASR
jgi:MoxR-like ATPase